MNLPALKSASLLVATEVIFWLRQLYEQVNGTSLCSDAFFWCFCLGGSHFARLYPRDQMLLVLSVQKPAALSVSGHVHIVDNSAHGQSDNN